LRDHGGNLDAAIARYGAGDWIDLSTGINRQPWPVPDLPLSDWTDLPRADSRQALELALSAHLGAAAPAVALPGAQAAIQLIPQLRQPGRAAVLSPTYNEHAGTLRGAGWHVTEPRDLSALAGADLAVVVNPNNPDGRTHTPADLMALAGTVGLLVVDESFADPVPDLSLAPMAGPGVIVLRSFGKFWGLAGLRLGFALGDATLVARMRDRLGPWPVAGPALRIGRAALADSAWAAATTARLAAEGPRLDALMAGAGAALVGGTHLFRLYDTDAAAIRDRLARHHIWSRVFPANPRWLRLGLPGSAAEWERLADALRAAP
jgi:cobalamin biosynthetic protein CobC